MDVKSQCALGNIEMVHGIKNPDGMFNRVYFWADFKPTAKCIRLMEVVAEGIGGIECVLKSNIEGTNFVVVVNRAVWNARETSRLWWEAFKVRIDSIATDEHHEYVIDGRRPDPTIANAAATNAKLQRK